MIPPPNNYDHPAEQCGVACTVDTCRRRYRRALGLGRREEMCAEDARREDEERAARSGTLPWRE